MATIQATGVGDRVTVGDAVIQRGSTANTKPVKARFLAFAASHRAYSGAAAAVVRAEAALQKQQGVVAERDVDQDEGVDALASALAGDGLPRTNPFKPLGVIAPTLLKRMGDEAEARECQRLVTAVRKRKGISTATKAAAARLEKVSKAVLASAKPVKALLASQRAAMTRRDVLAQMWSNAFAALKRAARAAEDDGARGLYAALFDHGAPAAKTKKRAAKGNGAPGSPTPGPT